MKVWRDAFGNVIVPGQRVFIRNRHYSGIRTITKVTTEYVSCREVGMRYERYPFHAAKLQRPELCVIHPDDVVKFHQIGVDLNPM